jgi:hypothetical protein
MRRTMFVLVVMGTTLALAAGVALAQATTETIEDTQPVEFEVFNDCSGEWVLFSGQFHSISHITQDAASGIHVVGEFNSANLQGTGLESGGQYTAQMSGRFIEHRNSGGFPIVLTTETTGNVIGQGQLPDFKAHFLLRITINENGTVTAEILRVRFECSNGSQ